MSPKRTAVVITVAATVSIVSGACGRSERVAQLPAPPAAATPGPDDEHHSRPPAGPFSERFTTFGSDYQPAQSFEDLARDSSLIVRARLDEIRDGRAFVADDGDRSERLIHVFTVVTVLKGTPAGGRVHVETMKPGSGPAADYDRAKPAGAEALLYLRPAATPSSDRQVVDPTAGLDPGATALWPTTPQGYLIVERGTVTHPLDLRATSLVPGEQPDEHDLSTWLPAPLRAQW